MEGLKEHGIYDDHQYWGFFNIPNIRDTKWINAAIQPMFRLPQQATLRMYSPRLHLVPPFSSRMPCLASLAGYTPDQWVEDC